jgi:glutamate/tyrosine decarboxylase-like PLP-dependent enzyme
MRALPAALALMHYGADRIGRNVQHNVECARWLAAHVEDHPDLELMAPPSLSICCFRYAPAGVTDEALDRINTGIRERLVAEGDFFLSPTRVGERAVLRACIISPATRAEHVESLVDAVIRLGAELLADD